jgi:hypothetical protein
LADEKVAKARIDVKVTRQGSMDLVDDVSATIYRVFTRRQETGAKEGVARADQRDSRVMRRAGFLNWRILFVTSRKGRTRYRML